MVILSLGCFSNYLKVSSCTRYWQCGRRILNILFVMCFYQFFSSFTCKLLPCFAMDGRHTHTVDQITEGDAMYVKAFDDGTIPDTKTLLLTHLPDRVRWPTVIQPN